MSSFQLGSVYLRTMPSMCAIPTTHTVLPRDGKGIKVCLVAWLGRMMMMMMMIITIIIINIIIIIVIIITIVIIFIITNIIIYIIITITIMIIYCDHDDDDDNEDDEITACQQWTSPQAKVGTWTLSEHRKQQEV